MLFENVNCELGDYSSLNDEIHNLMNRQTDTPDECINLLPIMKVRTLLLKLPYAHYRCYIYNTNSRVNMFQLD